MQCAYYIDGIYSLFILLYREHPTKMILALLFGLLGIASYVASNKAVEMFFLSREYWSASAALSREVYLSTAQNMILEWNGTAFDIYYILNRAALFLIAFAMLKSRAVKKSLGVLVLISAFFMIIPSNFGLVGLIFSLLSLIPWYIFSVMIAGIFFRYSKL